MGLGSKNYSKLRAAYIEQRKLHTNSDEKL
jgi:hypothetical protein